MTDFAAVHARLAEIMRDAAAAYVVTVDKPGNPVVRTATLDAKGQPGWFGTVTTKKSYVAYHLMPLYDDPALAATVPPALARRQQGKTCFNFKAIDADLFRELAALTRRAAAG